MKTAYVTGATGCLGRNLVDVLLREGWTVTVLHRRSSDLTRLDGCDVRFREVDLHRLDSVRRAVDAPADALFHVAGNTSHWAAEAEEQWRDNVLATRNLVAVSLERKLGRFVFTSTGATLGYQGLDAAGAERIPNGYVRTKRLAELEVYGALPWGLDAVVLQPIIVFGPWDTTSYAKIFQSMQDSPVKICFPGRIAFCDARDVATAHVRAFERGRAGEHYVLGGTYTTWQAAGAEIGRQLGVKAPLAVPRWALFLASLGMSAVAHVTGKKPLLTPDLIRLLGDAPDVSPEEARKARTELGYASRPLAVTIADCSRWLVSAGLLRPALSAPLSVLPE